MRTIEYWYCPNCREELLASRVTYQEKCDTCGHPVVWVEGIDPNRITEICQAEREGKLVVLPCKVGDVIYELSPLKLTYTLIKVPNLHTIARWIEDRCFGDYIFLTKAEAEKALKERGNGRTT